MKSFHIRVPFSFLTVLFYIPFYQCYIFQENIFRGILSCEKHRKSTNAVIVTHRNVTQIECAAICGLISECSGINYCATSGEISCDLLPPVSTAVSCDDLDSNENCDYFHKGPCWNGGIYRTEDGTCECPYNFAGLFCQRYLIGNSTCNFKNKSALADCVEAYTQGYRHSAVTVVQPNTEIQPFKVKCRLAEQPAARIMKRNKLFTDRFSGKLWSDFKYGFGLPAMNNMWMGLEKIHSLLNFNKRQYTAKITVHFAAYNSSSVGFLDGFSVADEAHNYTLSFASFHSEGTVILPDAFTDVGSSFNINGRQFCTPDRDCEDCAKGSNTGWWFSTSCEGVNFNVPVEQFVWPNGSYFIPIDKFSIDLIPI